MKRVETTLWLILLLFAVVARTSLVSAIGSEPPPSYPEIADKSPPVITIQSPKINQTYNGGIVYYSFSVQKPVSWFSSYPGHGDLILISYLIDQKKFDVASTGLDRQHYSSDPMTFDGVLPELTEGNHSLQVYVRSVSYYLDPNRPTSGYGYWLYPPANYYLETYSAIVPFTLDTTPPSISILSIENKTYFGTALPLDFWISEPTSRVMYCLDNSGNITVTENAVLSGLSTGTHDLIVYATDMGGNAGASQTVTFIIAQKAEPTSIPYSSFPTIMILIASI
ncbi:MAG: hypothetical protein M1490_02190, partial [Candidatus Bathyarchaeota archaeon]|nr:hypothetical protein [Candidatus Bathyarchaeota archaeon]